MSFYLSWSVTKLFFTLLLTHGMLLAAWFHYKDKPTRKIIKIAACIVLGFVLGSAIGVGVRQGEIDRSRFNADAPQAIEVPVVKRQNALTAEEAYEEVLKSKKE